MTTMTMTKRHEMDWGDDTMPLDCTRSRELPATHERSAWLGRLLRGMGDQRPTLRQRPVAR
jgi:hypothetical protein